MTVKSLAKKIKQFKHFGLITSIFDAVFFFKQVSMTFFFSNKY